MNTWLTSAKSFLCKYGYNSQPDEDQPLSGGTNRWCSNDKTILVLVARFQIDISILLFRHMQLDRLVSGVSPAAGLKSGQSNRKRNLGLALT